MSKEINYQEEIKNCKSVEDLVGKNGLMKRLFKDVMQQLLDAEMEEHLGRTKYERCSEENSKNYRNGTSNKTVRSSYGDVELDIPRDRNGDFNPVSVKKYKKDCNEFDQKIIGLYARGMSTRDIQSEMEELYGIELSPSAISHITDKVLVAAAEWQNRMLDKVYPIVYMDAIHFKVREDNKIVSKAAYICLGIDMNGYKDILGIWIGEAEGAKIWLSVCNDLNNRGVKDILIACMDGLRGLPEAIKAVFPNVCIQNCIVHQIRNSLKYISYKDKKDFMKDLKLVYTAETVELALSQLDMLKEKWDYKYANVIDSWYSNWNNLSTFFDFSSGIRKMIYTTNLLEGFNRQLRKFTKIRTVFPTDESLRKSLYLATDQVMKKWTSPIANWGPILLQFEIIFAERIETALAI
ncbi:IS256-like element ISCpe3 family transposase [Clostridium perfringens]|uniref:IS256-like element ISCpe3 family transposase n=1 Tax=Clostridium perfringens TaxID=1502 RepID=UPI001CCA02B6|nr:IS256-like element ISCpe3 family transposase [Clostridium perfringens]UBK61340.1 IS256-like element ISCpe3 family transposase [Clostridium perfringens]